MVKHTNLRVIVAVSAILMMVLLAFSASAQTGTQPSIEAVDQLSLDGTVLVPRVITDSPAFVVIYSDDGAGGLGQVLGYTPVGEGELTDVRVAVETTLLTPTLHAVLHTDDNEIGVYEFGSVEGADAPMTLDGDMSEVPFTVQAITALDQIVEDTVMISSVTVSEPTWVVIHAGDAQNFGEAIGHALVPAGTTTGLTVEVESDMAATGVLWPMLHSDTGTQGQFDFGTIEGEDVPLVVGDKAATLPISPVPIVRVAADQLILEGSGVVSGETASVEIGSVLSDGSGFLAVHSDDGGNLGPVIGFTPVPDGLSTNLTVDIDTAEITPNLWVTLHTDDNEIGTFEFGSVEEADMPVMVNEQMVSAVVQVAPFMSVARTLAESGQLAFDRVLVNQPAFVVIHAGDPMGPVLAEQPVNPGLNTNVMMEVDLDTLSEPIYMVLHADTNAIGTLEFGAVDGADAPMLLNGNIISSVLNLSTLSSELGCTVLANADTGLYSEASTGAQISGSLSEGQTIEIVGQVQTEGGVVWWQTNDGQWIPSDAVSEQVSCEQLPVVAD